MINIIIVDDELGAINNLKWGLEEFIDDVKVIETFTSAEEAIHGINYLKPDCVFLDIEMPGKDGFTLLSELAYKSFNLVIVTAHEDYALKAFKEDAVDYLLKPIDIDDLRNTIRKIRERSQQANLAGEIQKIVDTALNGKRHKSKISLPVDGKIIMFHPTEILYCKSDANYTNVCLENGQELLLSKNLKQVFKLLTQNDFIRVHNSYIININHIREYNKGDGGYLVMQNSSVIPVSRTYKNNLLAVIGNGPDSL